MEAKIWRPTLFEIDGKKKIFKEKPRRKNMCMISTIL